MIYSLQNIVYSPEETGALARAIAPALRAGDVVALRGDLGAGKTVFARELVNALTPPGQEIEVTSPTFPMVQFYELPSVNVAHFDLYRMNDPAELEELGFADALGPCVVLVEWPERAESDLPEARLDISIAAGADKEERVFLLEGRGSWAERLRRLEQIAVFLDLAGWATAERRHLHGDASTRLFQRLEQSGQRAILIDAPKQPDTPALRDGKSYRELVHSNDGATAFIAIDGVLRKHGFAAPEILFADAEQGLLLVEDFGSDEIVRGKPPAPMIDRYKACIDVLVKVAGEHWPRTVRVGEDFDYDIPQFDDVALLTEAELIVHWFAAAFSETPLGEDAPITFADAWADAFMLLHDDPHTLALRDFHSPNVIWRGDRAGIQKVGLIDFQDAVLTHPAYDLVSLLQDARVDISAEVERDLLAYYVKQAGRLEGFNEAHLRRAYAIMGAQRNCKLLGLFVRLAKRDAKAGYLRHLPRIAAYLKRNLDHAALAPLRIWFERNLPIALDADKLRMKETA